MRRHSFARLLATLGDPPKRAPFRDRTTQRRPPTMTTPKIDTSPQNIARVLRQTADAMARTTGDRPEYLAAYALADALDATPVVTEEPRFTVRDVRLCLMYSAMFDGARNGEFSSLAERIKASPEYAP